jgi:hypothetical protein
MAGLIFKSSSTAGTTPIINGYDLETYNLAKRVFLNDVFFNVVQGTAPLHALLQSMPMGSPVEALYAEIGIGDNRPIEGLLESGATKDFSAISVGDTVTTFNVHADTLKNLYTNSLVYCYDPTTKASVVLRFSGTNGTWTLVEKTVGASASYTLTAAHVTKVYFAGSSHDFGSSAPEGSIIKPSFYPVAFEEQQFSFETVPAQMSGELDIDGGYAVQAAAAAESFALQDELNLLTVKSSLARTSYFTKNGIRPGLDYFLRPHVGTGILNISGAEITHTAPGTELVDYGSGVKGWVYAQAGTTMSVSTFNKLMSDTQKWSSRGAKIIYGPTNAIEMIISMYENAGLKVYDNFQMMLPNEPNVFVTGTMISPRYGSQILLVPCVTANGMVKKAYYQTKTMFTTLWFYVLDLGTWSLVPKRSPAFGNVPAMDEYYRIEALDIGQNGWRGAKSRIIQANTLKNIEPRANGFVALGTFES